MEDRFTPGMFAGLIGDVVLQIYFIILQIFGITVLTYVDYGKILIMGKPFRGALAYILGTICEFTLGGILGIFFSYIVKYTTSYFYLVKAVFLSFGAWLIFLVPGTLFRLPMFSVVLPTSALLMLAGSLLWGITTGISLKVLTKNFEAFYKE